MQNLKVNRFLKDIKDKCYTHSINCCLNPSDNGGEATVLSVDFFDNGDLELIKAQKEVAIAEQDFVKATKFAHEYDASVANQEYIYTNVFIQTYCYGTSRSEIGLFHVGLKELAKAIELINEENNKKTTTNFAEVIRHQIKNDPTLAADVAEARFNANFASAVYQAREKLGYARSDLHKMTGLSVEDIESIEESDFDLTLDIIKKLSKALDLSFV